MSNPNEFNDEEMMDALWQPEPEDWFESMVYVYGYEAVVDGLKNGTQDI